MAAPLTPSRTVVELVPLMRLPRQLGVFDYLAPPACADVVRRGQLVRALFRKRPVLAIIWRVKPKPPQPRYRYQTFSEVVDRRPWLTDGQLALAAWVKDYYAQSLAVVINVMVFAPPMRFVEPAEFPPDDSVATPGPPLPQLLEPKTWLSYDRFSPDTIARLAVPLVRAGRQVLVITPEVAQAKAVVAALQLVLGQRAVLFPDFRQRLAMTQLWLRARRGDALAVVGTRRAVFAPLPRLGLVLVIDEHDASLKQWDQNPRYHAREAAAVVARQAGCALVYASVTPSVMSVWRSRRQLIEPFPPLVSAPPASLTLVDLQEEYAARNFSPLSRLLQEQLRRLPDGHGLQAMLFVQRKGVAGFMRCRDCGYVPRCATCDLPLRSVHSPASGPSPGLVADLRCYRCGETAVLARQCPECRGVRFKPVGSGAQTVLSAVRQACPHLGVARFDADLTRSQQALVAANVRAGRVAVVVATRFGWSLSDVASVPLVAAVSPDIALQLPDYRAAERTLQVMAEARAKAREQFIIQTLYPAHPVYQALGSGDLAPFYDHELATRQALHYPPFGQLVRLICARESSAAAQAEATAVADRLRRTLGKCAPAITIAGPQRSLSVSRRRQAVWEIVLKAPWPKNQMPAFPPAALSPSTVPWAGLLADLPASWVVDVDPEEL